MLLSFIVASCLVVPICLSSAQATLPRMRDLAKPHGIAVGAALNWAVLNNASLPDLNNYTGLAETQYSMAVPEQVNPRLFRIRHERSNSQTP